MRKFTYNEVSDFVNNLEYVLLTDNYCNNNQKLSLIDKEGFLYYVTLLNLKCGAPKKFHTSNPYTIYNIKLWCQLNNKPFKLINEIYKGNKKKLGWRCLKTDCGEVFKLSWDCVYTGIGCSFCAGRSAGLSNCLATKNPELASEWHPTLNGRLTPYDVTANSNKQVWWKCLKNEKHEWKIGINNRNSRGDGCPYCAGRLPSEDYNLLVVNPELCKEWDYERNKKRPEEYCPNSSKSVWWICKECGHKWSIAIYNRNYMSGCPKCIYSNGEAEIVKILNNNSINYIFQHTFSGCKDLRLLKFDLYLLDYNACIEYQGGQHYFVVDHFGGKNVFEKQQKHDQIKRDYCNKNNIKLIEIPYWEFNNIEEILRSNQIII